MRINQNINSLDIYKNYKKALQSQSISLDRISSGDKIKSAKDNPSKLGQSEQMRMNIRGMQMAQNNLQDNVSMLQAADGDLDSIGKSLIRIKELLVQGSNETNNQEELESIQHEINQLKSHIDYTAKNANFNGVNIIGNGIGIDTESYRSIPTIIGSNANESINIPVFNVSSEVLSDGKGNFLKDVNIMEKNRKNIDLSVLDSNIEQISAIRSKYGAISNRMITTSENLLTNIDTATTAESGIRDADISEEILEFTRTSILSQAGMSLMVQSNNFPNDVIKVLERLNN